MFPRVRLRIPKNPRIKNPRVVDNLILTTGWMNTISLKTCSEMIFKKHFALKILKKNPAPTGAGTVYSGQYSVTLTFATKSKSPNSKTRVFPRVRVQITKNPRIEKPACPKTKKKTMIEVCKQISIRGQLSHVTGCT